MSRFLYIVRDSLILGGCPTRQENGIPTRVQSVPVPAVTGGANAEPPAAALLTGLGMREFPRRPR